MMSDHQIFDETAISVHSSHQARVHSVSTQYDVYLWENNKILGVLFAGISTNL